MIEITDKTYDRIAQRLADAIGTDDYYSGTVCWECPEFYSELRSTLIVYHSTQSAPDGTFDSIRDIVPVWWTFSTTLPEGEALNDFDFTEIKRRITE